MVFKNLWVLVLLTKVASALEGLNGKNIQRQCWLSLKEKEERGFNATYPVDIWVIKTQRRIESAHRDRRPGRKAEFQGRDPMSPFRTKGENTSNPS